MRDDEIAALLDQDATAAQLFAQLDNPVGSVARLTGASGSGKSHIARRVATHWRSKGGRCVVAVGDGEQAWRALYPLLSGLSRAHRDWSGLATTGARSAIRAADAAAGTSGAGTSIFDVLTSTFRHETERVLLPYTRLERDVILDLRRLSRWHRVLLVADNAHWWDAESLRLLHSLLSQSLREVMSSLNSVSVLLVDSADEQATAAPEAFAAVTADCRPRTTRIARCTREQFSDVLRAFGLRDHLPEPIVAELFGVTNGHLKLAEQIAASHKHAAPSAPTLSIDDSYLSGLIAERLASLGLFGSDVSDLLVRAALLGLSCAEQDLSCLADRKRAELRALIKRAESIGFVERAADQITFSHEVIRSTILSGQAASDVEGLWVKVATCLAALRPGDYAARAQALLQGGDPAQAREMIALAGVAQIRRGIPIADVLRQVALQASDDPQMISYLEAVASGYEAVATGGFEAALPRLKTPVPSETATMAAERNYIAAICILGSQSLAAAQSVVKTLESWISALEHELELALRFLILLQQAQVLAEGFDDARATETLIEQKLSARAHYDVDAATMIQIQNRRASALMAPEIAEDRIRTAVDYFRRGTGEPSRDALELFRGLSNLSAIEIRLDKNAEAYAHASEAERLAVESLGIVHRLDVLASNLALAGLRSGVVPLDQTIARQKVLVHSEDASDDSFLQRCNLAAYQLLASRDAEARAKLDSLGEEIHLEEIDETYLVYYWTALSVARAALQGDTEEAMRIHRGMDSFVDALGWPCASYIRRRQRLLADALPKLRPDEERSAADRLLLDAGPRQIGRAWAYYGRLIPCCELSFWSDS